MSVRSEYQNEGESGDHTQVQMDHGDKNCPTVTVIVDQGQG